MKKFNGIVINFSKSKLNHNNLHFLDYTPNFYFIVSMKINLM